MIRVCLSFVFVLSITLVLPSCLFSQTGVAPTNYIVFRGIQLNGQISDFAESDDVTADFNPGFILNGGCAPLWLIFDGFAPDTTQFSIESHANTPNLRCTVEAFDWTINQFDVLDNFDESFNEDSVVLLDIDPNIHTDFVGNVRARYGWRVTGFILAFPWRVNVDRIAFCAPE